MKVLRKILFSLFLLLTLTTIFIASTNKVSAYTSSAAIVTKGAQVRTTGNQGIRFVGEVTSSYENKGTVAKYGIAIAYGEATEFGKADTVNEKTVLFAECDSLTVDNGDGTGLFYVTLYNVPEASFTQVVTARAYVILDDNTVVYSTTVATRSLTDVSLKAYNDNITSTLITEVINYITGEYKFVGYNFDGSFGVTSEIKEDNLKNLAQQFFLDYKETTGSTLASFSSADDFYNDAKAPSGSDISTSKIYTFLHGNAKWGWLVNFIINADHGSYTHPTRQARAILADGTIDEDGTTGNDNLWSCNHFIYSLHNFFNKTYNFDGFGATTINFTQSSRYDTFSSDNRIYKTTDNYELIKKGSQIAMPPALTPENGYYWAGWYLDGSKYDEANYTASASNALFVPTIKAIEYTITYMDGVNTINTLTPTTYTIESSEITLPTYVKSGYSFDGWYSNSSLETAVTKIATGSTGSKTFYAKTTASSNAVVGVTYDANGGMFTKDHIAGTAVKTINVANNDIGKNTYCNVATSNYFTNSACTNSLRWQYKMVLKYVPSIDAYRIVAIPGASSTGTMTVINATYDYDILIVCASDNFGGFTVGQYIVLSTSLSDLSTGTLTPVVSAKAYNQSAFQTSFSENLVLADTALPVVYKEGFTFAGWKSSLDDSVVTSFPGYTTDPGDITYTAQWTED